MRSPIRLIDIHNGRINISTSCSVQPNPAWAAWTLSLTLYNVCCCQELGKNLEIIAFLGFVFFYLFHHARDKTYFFKWERRKPIADRTVWFGRFVCFDFHSIRKPWNFISGNLRCAINTLILSKSVLPKPLAELANARRRFITRYQKYVVVNIIQLSLTVARDFLNRIFQKLTCF